MIGAAGKIAGNIGGMAAVTGAISANDTVTGLFGAGIPSGLAIHWGRLFI